MAESWADFIERCVNFSHFEMVWIRFNNNAGSQRVIHEEPVGIKGPVTAKFNHCCFGRQTANNFVESPLLLGFVVAAATADEFGHPRAAVTVRQYLQAVMHCLNASSVFFYVNLSCALNFGYAITVFTASSHRDPIFDRSKNWWNAHCTSSPNANCKSKQPRLVFNVSYIEAINQISTFRIKTQYRRKII
jgi:hypothetical protein